MTTLNKLVQKLESTKITERQQALSELRRYFENDNHVQTLDKTGKCQDWIVMFHQLSNCVFKERTEYLKKRAKVAADRLSNAASTLRWLIERSVTLLNYKAVEPLLSHLLKHVHHDGDLLAPAALDYIKAMKAILTWTPHMDHLDHDHWIRVVSLCFSIILGDSIRRDLPEQEDDLPASSNLEDVDSDMYEDGDGEESEISSPRKRRRGTPNSPAGRIRKAQRVQRQTVTPEQVELMSLLAIMLQSSSNPLLSPKHPRLRYAVLNRLERFLRVFPTDTSLRRDYVVALSATMEHLALNCCHAIGAFAARSWDGLVAMWDTKDRGMKETLVGVLKVIYPFLTAALPGQSDHAGGIARLWQILDGEAASRWGVEGLSLDSLRLGLCTTHDKNRRDAFVANTFSSGWHFDASQALAWAILELQADCTAKLFTLSESVNGSATDGTPTTKTSASEKPLETLLQTLQLQSATELRTYRLQILLFFIDRHWNIVHEPLRLRIIDSLLQYVSSEEPAVQSTVFVCLAAIAYAESVQVDTSHSSTTRTSTVWDPVWTHAVRRAYVPAVCRAACHAAFVMLTYSKDMLTGHRVLSEIETLAKDLDVQGPSFPFDSVCAFLSSCLKVASQDVRLYRMQLEEKALTWLMDNWRVGDYREDGFSRGRRSKMPPNQISDVVLLLETICAMPQKVQLYSQFLPAESSLADVVREQQRTAVIRDFLLNANLSSIHAIRPSSGERNPSVIAEKDRTAQPSSVPVNLSQPRARERKISGFLIRSQENILLSWNGFTDDRTQPTAEQARQVLDTAVVAITFETALLLNGTQPERRNIQAACKLFSKVIPFLGNGKWTSDELALVLLALMPLVAIEEGTDDDGWNSMVWPDTGTGVRRETLKRISKEVDEPEYALSSRRALQRYMWQSSDLQDVFSEVMTTLKHVLHALVRPGPPVGTSGHMHGGMDPSFPADASSRRGSQSQDLPMSIVSVTHAQRRAIDGCMTFLALAPILQSSSGEATRDRVLTDLVLESPTASFLEIGPPFFNCVRRRTLNFSVSTLEQLLVKFEHMLLQYSFSRNERAQLLVVHFLDATRHVWSQASVSSEDAGDRVRALCHWLSSALDRGLIRSWTTRDRLSRFLDVYLAQDPRQEIWSALPEDEEDRPVLPSYVLPRLGSDEDTRVRFRVAVSNARLFTLARSSGEDQKELYTDITQSLCKSLEQYEHMITRILCLGNIMITSSSVRRGAYWHLLETFLYQTSDGLDFTRHIQAILVNVAGRMGLNSFSDLFLAYSSQIALSVRDREYDLLQFPPRLLGFQDRRECAEKTFSVFTLANSLREWTSPDSQAQTFKLFANQCKIIGLSTQQGITVCFADIVGYQIVAWVDKHLDCLEDAASSLQLDSLLRAKTAFKDNREGFKSLLRANVDSVVVAILRALGDQDYTSNGSIAQALKEWDPQRQSVRVFRTLVRYRTTHGFQPHPPNLPAYGATTILKSLTWLFRYFPDVDLASISYHVVHQVFAHIQSSPLLNEQFRLLVASCLWIAAYQDHFREPALLRAIAVRATALLGQLDLSHAAQSILEWVFDRIGELNERDLRLSDVLVHICCTAHDFSRDLQDTDTAALGDDLLAWVESQTIALCRTSVRKAIVEKALPAWPREPCTELSSLCKITWPGLSSVLGDSRISSNKFRMARRLREVASSHGIGTSQFGRRDFWRLKECIPDTNRLQDEDVEAFADLLVIHHGHLDSFVTDRSDNPGLLAHHRRIMRKKEAGSLGDSKSAPQRPIVQHLLAVVDKPDGRQVYAAYRTLRFLISSCLQDHIDLRSWSPDYRQELEFFQSYSRTFVNRPLKQINDLASLDSLPSDFHTWILRLSPLLADVLASEDSFYGPLAALLETDQDLAEQLLPILVHTILQQEVARVAEALGSRELISKIFTSVVQANAEVATLRTIVTVVLHLRNFAPPGSKDALSYDKWLDVDYSLLSRSAVACGLYTTALLFLELSLEYGHASRNDAAAEEVLFDIYSHIEEPDGFYGIQTTDLRQFLMKRFHHEHQWDKAFQFHGAALEASTKTHAEVQGIQHALHSFGFNSLALSTGYSFSGGQKSSSDLETPALGYDIGWRTETWDLPERANGGGASLYTALRAVHRERDEQFINDGLRNAFSAELQRLRDTGDENLAEIRRICQSLMCLNQITQWRSRPVQQRLQKKVVDVPEWSSLCDISTGFDFADAEAILATRVSLIRSVRRREEREQIGDMVLPFTQFIVNLEKRCLLRLSEAARTSQRLQIALNSVTQAQTLENLPSTQVSQEFANVLWVQREQKLAVQLLKQVIAASEDKSQSALDGSLECVAQAKLLARLGTWVGEACLEKPTDIVGHFFSPAAAALDRASATNLAPREAAFGAVYHQFAVFAERQYLAILQSPDAIRWRLYVDRKKQEIARRKADLTVARSHSPMDADRQQRELHRATAVLREDESMVESHTETRDAFLEQAVTMFARCLETCDIHDDDSAIRLCSLWFANFDVPFLQQTVKGALERVPSRKFVFLAHQLSARLSASHSGRLSTGQEALQEMLIRMCREHPFHSLYQVFCLRSEGGGSRNSGSLNRRQSARHDPAEQTQSQMDRATAATQIFDRLRQDDDLSVRVRDVEFLCDASLQWAKLPIKNDRQYQDKEKKKRPFPIPASADILKVKNLRVPVITTRPALDPSMRYDHCIWIDHYEPAFQTAGGVNLPKISVCVGSDGVQYKQLFKGEGNDDLRQDAVMEQVFDVVNMVLAKDRETLKRKLNVRGYKVVPLAAQAGVLEFVGNTLPLGEWLNKAHAKYNPQDMPQSKVYAQLKELRERTKHMSDHKEQMQRLFVDIRRNFRPVMRHWFTERQKVPISWFAMRLNYSRSVATTSVVGHILGLGDRHTSNILLDNSNGEVVHIDLGIAFEQGRHLPIPERVPFRMTADMVDGMGMSGTQGVFQRCAEETLRVLRDGSDVILTVLEVFRHDPLHSWTASEVKVKRAQESAALDPAKDMRLIGIDMTSGGAEEAADRALTSVKRKLDKALSVEYTVNELIAEATDTFNLGNMFQGWAPHL